MAELRTRVVDFNKLPQTVRERFIASAASQQLPVPILADRLGVGAAAVGWGFLCVSGVGGLLGLGFAGFGNSWSDMSIQSPLFVAAYVVCAFAAVYSVLAIVRRRKLLSSLPYQPGRYLFPMDFVDARSHELRIVPLAMLADLRGVHHHTNGAYTHTDLSFRFEDGTSESLTVRGKDQAEIVLADLRQRQGEVSQAIQDRDVEALFQLDPFIEARLGDKWETEEPAFFGGEQAGPRAKPVAGLLARPALVALAAGVLLGAPLWYGRNLASDEAAYAELSDHGSEWSVEQYIERGGRHADEARSELLPRAALREARQQGTVTGLRRVIQKYGEHAVAGDARKEIEALFAKTVAEFHSQAAADKEMLAFMDKLFAHLEKNDAPAVEVRFGKPSATDLKTADEVLNREVEGGVVPISGHFDEDSSAPRERAIVASLQDAFSTIFPADILVLQQGKRLTEDAGAADKPVLDIHYDVRPSGDTYTSEQTGKNFVGIRVTFAVSMRLPGDEEGLTFVLEVEPPERFSVGPSPLDRYGVGEYSGPGAGAVYHAMATNAFAQLDGKLRKVFFRAGTVAYEGRGGSQARADLPTDLPAGLPGLPPYGDL